MSPESAELVGWIFLALGFASALVIVADELLLGYRQQMWIMNLVHPITALYWGPVWLWLYKEWVADCFTSHSRRRQGAAPS